MRTSTLHSSPDATSTGTLLSVVVSGLVFSLVAVIDGDALDERIVVRSASATVAHLLATGAAALHDPTGVSGEAPVDVWVRDVKPVVDLVGMIGLDPWERGWLVASLWIVDVARDLCGKQMLRDQATSAEDIAKVSKSHAAASAHCIGALDRYGSSVAEVRRWVREHTDSLEVVKVGVWGRHC